ncbi:hypothetical protein JVT61DRAFT_15117 [Boletus reticuloceps]|uniref:C2H2-type domain-containing protein n=1 Tax=Boletus reticuloceps TaxID=495285 RepID=A0A8I2YTY9_9AGAM|nr:hypothetical protein JVT61DRAFT_15117 [Boletus reticuloceps]
MVVGAVCLQKGHVFESLPHLPSEWKSQSSSLTGSVPTPGVSDLYPKRAEEEQAKDKALALGDPPQHVSASAMHTDADDETIIADVALGLRRVPTSFSTVVRHSGLESPTNARVSDQRPTGPELPKIHQCKQCGKMFPRASGLATHMNSHLGAKPYKCIVPNCDRSFAVRSNAKRHLRTHGINPSSDANLTGVGFEEPVDSQVHDAGKQPSRYRWIAQSPSPHVANDWGYQGSSSSATDGSSFQTSASSAVSAALSGATSDDFSDSYPRGHSQKG